MFHSDFSLLVRLLADFAGSAAHGGLVDLKIVVASRNARDASFIGWKLHPPPETSELLPLQSYFIWESRIQHDWQFILDGDLRSIAPEQWMSIAWEQMHAAPKAVADKLQAFLGWEVHQQSESNAVPVLRFVPETQRFNLPGESQAPPATDSTLSLSAAFELWWQQHGQGLCRKSEEEAAGARLADTPDPLRLTPIEQRIADNLLMVDVPSLDENASLQPLRAFQQLAHEQKDRKLHAGSELITQQSRRTTAYLHAVLQGSATAPLPRSVELLRFAAQPGGGVTSALRALQFPSEKVNCANPALQFLVFDGFSASAPSTEQSQEPSSSTAESPDLSAQVHSLARTLSVALLTGRTLVIPSVPNSLSALLDLTAISPCSVEDVTQSTPLHSLPRDPFDASQRVVSFSASEYAVQWLIAPSSGGSTQARSGSPSRPPFVSRTLGVHEFVSSLVGFLMQPSSATLTHVAEVVGEAADVGVLLPSHATSPVSYTHLTLPTT